MNIVDAQGAGNEYDRLEQAKGEAAANFIGTAMANGDDEQTGTAFKVFNVQAQRMKDVSRLKRMGRD